MVKPKTRVFNATPIVSGRSLPTASASNCRPLKTVEITNNVPQLALLGAPNGMQAVTVLHTGDDGGDFTVWIADLRSTRAPVLAPARPPRIDFVNEMDCYVQVVRVDEFGAQHDEGAPVRPGGGWQQVSGHAGVVWLVRASSPARFHRCVMTDHPHRVAHRRGLPVGDVQCVAAVPTAGRVGPSPWSARRGRARR